jgi:hypothetical protein
MPMLLVVAASGLQRLMIHGNHFGCERPFQRPPSTGPRLDGGESPQYSAPFNASGGWCCAHWPCGRTREPFPHTGTTSATDADD